MSSESAGSQEYSGLKEKECLDLELEICSIWFRYQAGRELEDAGTFAFVGYVCRRAIEFVEQKFGERLSQTDWPRQQKDLAALFDQSSSDFNKFLNGKQKGGVKKGRLTRTDWISVAREVMSFITTGERTFNAPKNSSAARIDYYLFRANESNSELVVSVWRPERRGSWDAWSYTEVGGELQQLALRATLETKEGAEIWFSSGGLSFFNADAGGPLADAVEAAIKAGVQVNLVYPQLKNTDEFLPVRSSFRAFESKVRNDNPIKYWPIPEERIPRTAFLNKPFRFIFMRFQTANDLWMIRPDLPEAIQKEVEEPTALRGRDQEREAFLEFLADVKKLISGSSNGEASSQKGVDPVPRPMVESFDDKTEADSEKGRGVS